MELTGEGIVYAILGVAVVIPLLFILRRPLKLLLKLAFSSALGLLLLIFLDLIGVPIGVNPVNAVCVGVLGLPGLASILIIRWLMLL